MNDPENDETKWEQAEGVLGNPPFPRDRLVDLAPRSLAHLGDAVFHLFEREREIVHISSARKMHARARVDAARQALLLDQLLSCLNDTELSVVRRARNVKATPARRSEQAIYRRATAFEALLGYLYLTDMGRLRQILALTLESAGSALNNDATTKDNT